MTMMIRLPLIAAFTCSLIGLGACKTPSHTAPQDPPPTEPQSSTHPAKPGTDPQPLNLQVTAPIILRERDDPTKWLFVETVRDGARGGWATGDFNKERNKLIIRTKDVDQFSIDTSRVRINWERLVILGIDGRNSELRKRDFAVYHFQRDRHGRWVVIE